MLLPFSFQRLRAFLMDQATMRTGMVVLGLMGLTCTAGIVLLACFGHAESPALTAIASAAVGGILGLLYPASANKPAAAPPPSMANKV